MTRDEQTRLLAEKVLGWEWLSNPGSALGTYRIADPDGFSFRSALGFRPFTSIADAWLLVEKLQTWECWLVCFTLNLASGIRWGVSLRELMNRETGKMRTVRTDAATLPEALCLAALKWLEVRDGEKVE